MRNDTLLEAPKAIPGREFPCPEHYQWHTICGMGGTFSSIHNGMKTKTLNTFAALFLFSGFAHAGDLQVVLEGQVATLEGAGILHGPFVGSSVGDSVRLSVDLTLLGSPNSISNLYQVDHGNVTLSIASIEPDSVLVSSIAFASRNDASFPTFPAVDSIFGEMDLSFGVEASVLVTDPVGNLLATADLNQSLGSYFLSSGTGSHIVLRDGPLDGLTVRLTDMHIIDIAPVGTPYCGPAATNSSGMSGQLSGEGSPRIESRRLQLTASGLPQNTFALFIVGSQRGFTPNPGGSQGDLCIGGSIGRFADDLRFTGNGHQVSVDLDTRQMAGPNGPINVIPGSTWNFQLWCRDLNPGPTTNFTNALEVTFQ